MSEEVPLRDQILEISRHLLYEEGYKSLSMRKIAKKADVSATSIYLYFESKDHLLHTLIEESVEDLSRFIESKALPKADSIERFKAITKSYVEFGLQNPEKYEIIYKVRSDSMARYPKEKFRKARRAYELLVKTIEESVDQGLMEVDQPVVAAYSIWAQLHGVVSVVLNKRLDSRIDREQFIEESIEHVVQGFLIRTTVL
ncbi:TetR/AcrR family transcriptional regulator [Gracilimonas sediminicola]|uniref:TetR/AcrR family transcriptional regulator n=1 Tax=Gracilimonas sediminicola TaxID=2952158 RepID=A0A9X2RGE3_9BACT|nr:TetR/AcrR family transcriptional regulator [Gracilimonas sediminicola]MCP9292302.1 TetR/AcrR family transcriptional regulator [Gracilimonas sediminicola]